MPTNAENQQKQRQRRLVRRLVDGVAGWLTYKQASGARTLYSEYFLYPTIYEIASGRGWSVLSQEPIINSTIRNGAPSTIDFVFYEKSRDQAGNYGFIMMEVKYLRGENTTQELRSLQNDFAKLRTVKLDEIRNKKSLSKCGAPDKWQLIIAQREAYERLSTCKSKDFSTVVDMLKTSLIDKIPQLVYRSVIETKLKSKFHWHVIAIGEKRWPSTSA